MVVAKGVNRSRNVAPLETLRGYAVHLVASGRATKLSRNGYMFRTKAKEQLAGIGNDLTCEQAFVDPVAYPG